MLYLPAVRTITEQMPQRQIHGQSPVILPYTKASLNRLDEATSKMQSRPDTKQSKKVSFALLLLSSIQDNTDAVLNMY